MSDYTPETSDVRMNYVDGTRQLHGKSMRLEDIYAEFDRWLAEHDREVIAKYHARVKAFEELQRFDEENV